MLPECGFSLIQDLKILALFIINTKDLPFATYVTKIPVTRITSLIVGIKLAILAFTRIGRASCSVFALLLFQLAA